MSHTSDRRPVSRYVAVTGVLGLVLSALMMVFTTAPASAAGPQTFPGAGYGAIPDGAVACAPTPGAPLNVTFTVSGLPSRALADVRVTGLAITHTFAGDVTATLIAPDTTTSVVIFGRHRRDDRRRRRRQQQPRGAGTRSSTRTPRHRAAGGPRTTAAANTDATIASGSYRGSAIGGAGSTGAAVDITPAFAAGDQPQRDVDPALHRRLQCGHGLRDRRDALPDPGGARTAPPSRPP